MSALSEDVEILVDTIKNCQKFHRPCIKVYNRLGEATSDITKRIFFDIGGVSTWAAYILTKRASESTGYILGRFKWRQLLARIEASTSDACKELATRLMAAIKPDCKWVERLVRVARQ
jgi:hypothetical protein